MQLQVSAKPCARCKRAFYCEDGAGFLVLFLEISWFALVLMLEGGVAVLQLTRTTPRGCSSHSGGLGGRAVGVAAVGVVSLGGGWGFVGWGAAWLCGGFLRFLSPSGKPVMIKPSWKEESNV